MQIIIKNLKDTSRIIDFPIENGKTKSTFLAGHAQIDIGDLCSSPYLLDLPSGLVLRRLHDAGEIQLTYEQPDGSLATDFHPAGSGGGGGGGSDNDTAILLDDLLASEPTVETTTYLVTRALGSVVQEAWFRLDDSTLKTIDYTRTDGAVSLETRTIYDADGSTELAILTIEYERSGGSVIGATYTRVL